MDDRQFDDLSRRIAGLALPRRTLMTSLGGASLAGALGLMLDPDAAEAKKNNKKKKCKKEGSRCDKQKCKKQDKKCCCNNLNCKNDVCEGKGPSCATTVTFNTQWGGTGSGQSKFDQPWGVTVDLSDSIYVTDTENQRVQVFNQSGAFLDEWGILGNEDDEFQEPKGIAFNQDSQGRNRINVADPGQSSANNNRQKLRKFRTDGTFEGFLGVAELTQPFGVTADFADRIWAVDNTTPGQVFLFDANGNPIFNWTPTGSGALSSPQGIAVFKDEDNSTFVYVADSGNDRVVKFKYVSNSADGLQFVTAAGSGGSGNSQFNDPIGIAIDDCGNLWVADRLNDRVQQLSKNLSFETRIISRLDRPTGVALNNDQTSLFVVNNGSDLVVKFDLSR